MFARRSAEIMLDTAALGYAALVRVAAEAPEAMHEQYIGAIEHLHHSALSYAGACGSLDAGERAELLALRRFRDGVVDLRQEFATGQTSDGEAIADARELGVETIDALLMLHGARPA